MTLSFDGNGNGQVSGDMSCTSNTSCSSKDFPLGTTATLLPSPDANSVFEGWSGACNGFSKCVVHMNASKTATATFTAVMPVKVAESNKFYSSLHDAYNDVATVSGNTIMGRALSLQGNLVLNRPINVTIRGGYDTTFQAQSDETTLHGKVAIRQGSLIADKFKLSNTSPVEDNTIASVTIVDGNNQTAIVGTELPIPLVALIQNKAGLPIAGQVVNFKVVSGGGTVFAGAAMSDANGIVRERWTLGTIAGAEKVEVRAVDSNGAAVVFATFDAIAVAGTPQSLSIISGNHQSSPQLQQLPLPVKVIVKDVHGNPKAGVSVEFTAHNGGVAFPRMAVTNAAGEVTATWTLGLAVGGQTLSATVTGVPSISFSATATQAPPGAATALAKTSGDMQTVVQHLLLPIPLQVVVTDALGNPVPDIQVTFSSNQGNGYIPLATVTDVAGKASWTGYFHSAGTQEVDVSVEGTATVTFNTTVTASNHQYDGEYHCKSEYSQGYTLSFKLMVVSGLLKGDAYTPLSGTLNEVDGTLTGIMRLSMGTGMNFSGRLMVDPFQRATGAGTSIINCLGCPEDTASYGTYACNRQ